ncbi:MAG: pilus assembly protein PilM [Chloroflexi bacterium]|nr:pilus assembly protein PilM [Chloroflexota bacterium]
MASQIVAVDVDSRSIRLLEINERRVERWASATLDPNTVRDGVVADPEALGAQIRNLVRSSGVRTGQVAASMSGLYSTSQILSLPPQTEREARRAVPGLARDAIPLEDVRLEWQLMPPNETGQEVLIQAIPASLVDTHLAALHSAGINPQIMETKTVALTRAVNRSLAIIVNAEPTSMDVVVVVDGVPKIMRTVAQPRDLPPEELADQVTRIVEQTVNYYLDNHTSLWVPGETPLFLLGSMADHPILVETVKSRLAFPIEPFDPPIEYPPHLPTVQYAVAIGLALELLQDSKDTTAENEVHTGVQPIHLNLIPRTIPWWKPNPPRLLFALGVMAGLALALMLMGAAADASAVTSDLRDEQNVISGRVQILLVGQKERTNQASEVTSYNELIARRGDVTQTFQLLQGLAPSGVEFRSFRLARNSVTVSGEAAGPLEAIALVTNLRNAGETDDNGVFRPFFDSVEYRSVSTGPGSFSITAARVVELARTE